MSRTEELPHHIHVVSVWLRRKTIVCKNLTVKKSDMRLILADQLTTVHFRAASDR